MERRQSIGLRGRDDGRAPAFGVHSPFAHTDGIWRWNYAKHLTCRHFEDRLDRPLCFVPAVVLGVHDGNLVRSFIMWDTAVVARAMATAIPHVDLVVSRTDDGPFIAAATSDVLLVLTTHSTWPADYEVAGGVTIGLWMTVVLSRLSPDQVLDAELIAEAASG